MIIEILIALLLGIIAGTITGLSPGIHINLVALMLLIASPFLLQYAAPVVLAVFIVSMSISHCFLDFITGIFLGAPDDTTALSVLPGHKLLLNGRGYEAVKLTTLGCFLGVLLLIIVVPLSVVFLPMVYDYIKIAIPFILIIASLFLILKEDKKFLAFLIFMLSGCLGIAVLNLEVIKQPLFPLLTGLFGTSMLLSSINQKTVIPKQTFASDKINAKETGKTVFAGVLSSFLCSFMPGLGASQAAVLGNEISRSKSEKNFLVLLGIISVLVTALNFAAIYIINKPRSGTAIIVEKLISDVTLTHLAIFCAAMIIAGSISVFLALFFAKVFAKNIHRINYSALSAIILLFLVLLCINISGLISLIVLVTATGLGLFAISTGVKKMHLMGCLILPVIMYFIL
jgi:putative membrane protein